MGKSNKEYTHTYLLFVCFFRERAVVKPLFLKDESQLLAACSVYMSYLGRTDRKSLFRRINSVVGGIQQWESRSSC